MNTSMTINATAPGCWRSTSPSPRSRAPTSRELDRHDQNDIIKEYLSRGTYVFPPEPSLRLTTDVPPTPSSTCRSGTR
jgi:ethylmalonyl-CoA mutase